MFQHCPIIEIGDIFTRIDKNGKVWKAEVIDRTEYFVDVKKTQPYKIKVGDEWNWHYEDAEPTFERCMLYRHYEEVETDEVIKGIFGCYKKKIKSPTSRYYINCKEDYSKHSKYDRSYDLIKYSKESSDAEEGFKLFYNYCEEN